MERYFELHYLIPEEELIAKYTNRRDKLQFILNDPDNGISKKHSTIKKNNSNQDYFLKLIYHTPFLFMYFHRYRSNDIAGDMPFSMP